ncbi:hypothetical protein J7T55_001223 [Diaporthe amygdali]|uniref:uncharacterized protein n=1 Tax=Phomopsis amygdali TaxID=1214568 RepID=UPI0022FE1AA7|nr:uncharacterized protein J7T55_001223 [Diaporthe amygdali]KAJ0103767.1 hypothetical protein J7T55_001223 [Diaporthe amygdali]
MQEQLPFSDPAIMTWDLTDPGTFPGTLSVAFPLSSEVELPIPPSTLPDTEPWDSRSDSPDLLDSLDSCSDGGISSLAVEK